MINLLENGLFNSMDRTLYLCFLIPVPLDTKTNEQNFKNSVRKKKICKPIGREMEYLGFFLFYFVFF